MNKQAKLLHQAQEEFDKAFGEVNMSYTKGEWTINRDYPKQGDLVIISESEAKSICKITVPSTGYKKECKANAQLIALSPRMYKAIQSAIVEIEDGSANHAHLILTEAIRELEER